MHRLTETHDAVDRWHQRLSPMPNQCATEQKSSDWRGDKLLENRARAENSARRCNQRALGKTSVKVPSRAAIKNRCSCSAPCSAVANCPHSRSTEARISSSRSPIPAAPDNGAGSGTHSEMLGTFEVPCQGGAPSPWHRQGGRFAAAAAQQLLLVPIVWGTVCRRAVRDQQTR